MLISTAQYISSNVLAEKCPPPVMPEYAFIGRSNVGKSSLINMLCNNEKLAHVSGTPGKTQVINHFLINKNWYLVDLPGYGFAKVSKVMREKFDKMIRAYLRGRPNLMCVFVLVDIRHEPQENDLKFMQMLAETQTPFCIAFTKCDKLSSAKLKYAVQAYADAMLEQWEEFPTHFLTSASSKRGKKELLGFIGETNGLFVKKK
jgi:GTP-binding protein